MEDPYRFGAHSARAYPARVAFGVVMATAALAALIATIIFESGGNTRRSGLILVWVICVAPGFIAALVAASKPRQGSVIAGFAVLAFFGPVAAYVIALIVAIASGSIE